MEKYTYKPIDSEEIKKIILAMLILIVLGLAFLGSYETYYVGFLFELLAILIFCLTILYIIAKEFEFIAAEKGYNGRRYFWYSFLFGIPGYLLIIALPKK